MAPGTSLNFCAPYHILSATNYEKMKSAEKILKKMLLLITGGAFLVKTSLFFSLFLEIRALNLAPGACAPHNAFKFISKGHFSQR